jgi:hypothetical protein
MVDAWTKQVLDNGPRNYRAVYTLVFTAMSPLANYLAADPTSSGDMGVNIAGNTLYPGTHLKIWELEYDMSSSQAVQIIWDATTPQNAFVINGAGAGKHHWKKRGGLYVPQSAGAPITGATGKILFTTLGVPTVGDMISIEMRLKKDIHQ